MYIKKSDLRFPHFRMVEPQYDTSILDGSTQGLMVNVHVSWEQKNKKTKCVMYGEISIFPVVLMVTPIFSNPYVSYVLLLLLRLLLLDFLLLLLPLLLRFFSASSPLLLLLLLQILF